MRFCLLFLFITVFFKGISQSPLSKPFKLSAYSELYYSYDFSKSAILEKPDFNYNYKKHNQPSLNLFYVKANYQQDKIRSNLALMLGDYSKFNLSNETNFAKKILEANVGVKLSKNKDFWVDFGVMPSHLGFESAIGADCWNLTRSLLAENSPYYETGMKLNYTNTKQNFYLSFNLLNGWQKIKTPSYIQQPSYGIQIYYKPTSSITLNYSNFIGTDKPDSANAVRIFHNFYAIYDPVKSFSIIAGLDIGSEQQLNKANAIWYSPVLIGRYRMNQKNSIAGRIEFFNDKQQILIQTKTPNGFQTFGVSINFDHQIAKRVLMRTEVKKYTSKDAIYRYQENYHSNISATLALIVKW